MSVLTVRIARYDALREQLRSPLDAARRHSVYTHEICPFGQNCCAFNTGQIFCVSTSIGSSPQVPLREPRVPSLTNFQRFASLFGICRRSRGGAGREWRASGCPMDRRTSPDRELVEEPHDRWLLAWPCSHMPCEIFVAHSAARDEQHALVWSDGREHPAHCAACVAFGVWWCGERCEDLGSVDFTASPSAVLARDRLGNCLGVLGSFRCAVVRGVLAEFGLVAKGRLSVASSPSHRSDPAPRSLFGPLGVCSAASAASCSSVSVHA